jgi:hypothetical protein
MGENWPDVKLCSWRERDSEKVELNAYIAVRMQETTPASRANI